MAKTLPVDEILRAYARSVDYEFGDELYTIAQAKADLLERLINELEKHKLNLGGMYNDAIEDCEKVLRKELE